MFFKTEKKLRALMHDIMTVRHSLLDKEAFIINKINQTQKHISQLEKRINIIADYIQGKLATIIEKASIEAVNDKYNMLWERFKELQREYVNDYNRLNKRQNETCKTLEKLTNKKTKIEKINKKLEK